MIRFYLKMTMTNLVQYGYIAKRRLQNSYIFCRSKLLDFPTI
jgi:hypothetical protein